MDTRHTCCSRSTEISSLSSRRRTSSERALHPCPPHSKSMAQTDVLCVSPEDERCTVGCATFCIRSCCQRGLLGLLGLPLVASLQDLPSFLVAGPYCWHSSSIEAVGHVVFRRSCSQVPAHVIFTALTVPFFFCWLVGSAACERILSLLVMPQSVWLGTINRVGTRLILRELRGTCLLLSIILPLSLLFFFKLFYTFQ